MTMIPMPSEVEKLGDRPTDGPWYVQENDTMGGWCICNVPIPPSRHDPVRGDRIISETIIRRDDAELICALRNAAWEVLHPSPPRPPRLKR